MDAREIEKCIDEFGTDIYRFCLKLCMDKSEAEDLYRQSAQPVVSDPCGGPDHEHPVYFIHPDL